MFYCHVPGIELKELYLSAVNRIETKVEEIKSKSETLLGMCSGDSLILTRAKFDAEIKGQRSKAARFRFLEAHTDKKSFYNLDEDDLIALSIGEG